MVGCSKVRHRRRVTGRYDVTKGVINITQCLFAQQETGKTERLPKRRKQTATDLIWAAMREDTAPAGGERDDIGDQHLSSDDSPPRESTTTSLSTSPCLIPGKQRREKSGISPQGPSQRTGAGGAAVPPAAVQEGPHRRLLATPVSHGPSGSSAAKHGGGDAPRTVQKAVEELSQTGASISSWKQEEEEEPLPPASAGAISITTSTPQKSPSVVLPKKASPATRTRPPVAMGADRATRSPTSSAPTAPSNSTSKSVLTMQSRQEALDRLNDMLKAPEAKTAASEAAGDGETMEFPPDPNSQQRSPQRGLESLSLGGRAAAGPKKASPTSPLLRGKGSGPQQGQSPSPPRTVTAAAGGAKPAMRGRLSPPAAETGSPSARVRGGKATSPSAPKLGRKKKMVDGSALDDVAESDAIAAENVPLPDEGDAPQYSGVTASDLMTRVRLTKGCPSMPALPITPHDSSQPARLTAVVVSIDKYNDDKILPCPAQTRDDADAVSLMLQVLGYKVFRINNSISKPATKDNVVGTIKHALGEAAKGSTSVVPTLKSDGEVSAKATVGPDGVCLVYFAGRGCEGILHGFDEPVHYLFHADTRLTSISRHNTIIVEELIHLRSHNGIKPVVMAEMLPVSVPLKGVKRVGHGMAMVAAGAKSQGTDMLVYYPSRARPGAFTWYLLKGLQGDAVRSGHVTPAALNAYIKETLHAKFLKSMSYESKDPDGVKRQVDSCFETDASQWNRETKGTSAIVGKDNLMFKYKAELAQKKKSLVTTPCRFVVDVSVDVRYLKDMKTFLKRFVKRAETLLFPTGKFYSAPSRRSLKLLQVFRSGEYSLHLDPEVMSSNLHHVITEGSYDDELEHLTGCSCAVEERNYPVTYRLYNSNAVIHVKTAHTNGAQADVSPAIFQRYHVENRNKIAGYHLYAAKERVSFYFAGCERDFLQFIKHGVLGSFCSPQLFSCDILHVTYQQLVPQLTFKQKVVKQNVDGDSSPSATRKIQKVATPNPKVAEVPSPSHSSTTAVVRPTIVAENEADGQLLGEVHVSTAAAAAARRKEVESVFLQLSKLQAKWRGHFLRCKLNPLRDGALSLHHERDKKVVQVEFDTRTALKHKELADRRGVLEFFTEYHVRLRVQEEEHRDWCQIVELNINFIFRRHEPGHRKYLQGDEDLELMLLYEDYRRRKHFIESVQYARILLGSVKIIAVETEKRLRITNIEASDYQKVKTLAGQRLMEVMRTQPSKSLRRKEPTLAGLY